MYGYSTVLTEAGNGLKRIDTTGGWSGAAADAFRKRFDGEPQRWLDAGTCFRQAAEALDRYIPALVSAQQQAATAIELWGQGHKDAANATLEDACGQLSDAAGAASAAVGRARDQAPQLPGFWSKIGNFFDGLWHDTEKAGAAGLDGLASLGNAAISNPLADLGLAGGAMLAGVSAVGDGAGFVLDATGVGAVVGVPVNVVSTAGVIAGTGLMMASGGDLVSHAAGDDRVDPVNTGGPAMPHPPRTRSTRPERRNTRHASRISQKTPPTAGYPAPKACGKHKWACNWRPTVKLDRLFVRRLMRPEKIRANSLTPAPASDGMSRARPIPSPAMGGSLACLSGVLRPSASSQIWSMIHWERARMSCSIPTGCRRPALPSCSRSSPTIPNGWERYCGAHDDHVRPLTRGRTPLAR